MAKVKASSNSAGVTLSHCGTPSYGPANSARRMLAGTGIGVVAGIAVTTQLAWVQQQIELLTGIDTLPATIYQFSTLPWEIDPLQVAVVVGIAMVLALGATLLPSRHGARLDPAEALRRGPGP